MKRLATALLFTALLATPALAGGDIPWGGVGWYVKVQGEGSSTSMVVSGPYASNADCDAYVVRARAEYPEFKGSRWCSYETVAWASPEDD
jgi:hypothetical protein